VVDAHAPPDRPQIRATAAAIESRDALERRDGRDRGVGGDADDAQQQQPGDAAAIAPQREERQQDRRDRDDEQDREDRHEARGLARDQAAGAERARGEAAAKAPQAAPTVSGARVASPGLGSETEPKAAAAAAAPAFPGADRLPESAQRPEVMIGAAFGGAFLLARILKRIFD
jgi:hypothetical protein